MTNPVLGFDISAYQPSNYSYFRQLKDWGAKYVFIKATEGTGYRSPVAGMQVYNANQAGIDVIGAYHFFHGIGKAEAEQFLTTVKNLGLDKTTPLALDAEATDAGYNSDFNEFLNTCWDYGYHHLYIYSMASWFWSKRINPAKLDHGHLWVANTGGTIGVNNATIWQFSWNYKGLNLDANYCFFPESLGLGTNHASPKASDSNYWEDGHKFKVISDGIQGYRSSTFNDSTKRTDLLNKGLRSKGFVLYAKPVKIGSIYRLKTKYDTWYTANKKYVEKIE